MCIYMHNRKDELNMFYANRTCLRLTRVFIAISDAMLKIIWCWAMTSLVSGGDIPEEGIPSSLEVNVFVLTGRWGLVEEFSFIFLFRQVCFVETDVYFVSQWHEDYWNSIWLWWQSIICYCLYIFPIWQLCHRPVFVGSPGHHWTFEFARHNKHDNLTKVHMFVGLFV